MSTSKVCETRAEYIKHKCWCWHILFYENTIQYYKCRKIMGKCIFNQTYRSVNENSKLVRFVTNALKPSRSKKVS